jgi:hypothetical protein
MAKSVIMSAALAHALQDAGARFEREWNYLALQGRCDAIGSAEFNRVFATWVGCLPSGGTLTAFIERNANRAATD